MKKKYLYILSQRYSGSTLLSFLLGTHSGISTIGERRKFYNKSLRPKLTETQECSCGATFENCVFWSEIKERILQRVKERDLVTNTTEFRIFNNRYIHGIASKLYQFALLNHFPKLLQPFSNKMEALQQFNQILVEEILALEGNSTFLDSSKIIDQALFLSQIEAFDFYVIWLARDPRAQVFSTLKYHDWTVEYATQKWIEEMDANERILTKMGIRHTFLQYEKLCRAPEKEMRRILEFAGLDASRFSLNFREQTQHIMGNRSMRLGKDAKIEERKDWQEKLKQEDIATIERMTTNYQQYYR